MKARSHVTLKVYDISGREVGSLANSDFEPGRYSQSLDAADWPSGIYFYSIKIGSGFSDTKKMLLVK